MTQTSRAEHVVIPDSSALSQSSWYRAQPDILQGRMRLLTDALSMTGGNIEFQIRFTVYGRTSRVDPLRNAKGIVTLTINDGRLAQTQIQSHRQAALTRVSDYTMSIPFSFSTTTESDDPIVIAQEGQWIAPFVQALNSKLSNDPTLIARINAYERTLQTSTGTGVRVDTRPANVASCEDDLESNKTAGWEVNASDNSGRQGNGGVGGRSER